MFSIDVIILSNGKNESLIKLTKQTIQSLVGSEDSSIIDFKILVIESNAALKPFQYESSETIYPDSKFGFHKYLNIGVSQTNNDLICFCNNDLIFHRGWASAMLRGLEKDPEIYSMSTFCPIFHSDKLDEIPDEINYGYKNGVMFTGWCFMVRRKVFDVVGKFDEKFTFWYADDDFRLTLQKYGLKNVLIREAEVTHLGSETLSTEANKKQFELQYSANAYYQYKWKHKNSLIYLLQKIRYTLKALKKK